MTGFVLQGHICINVTKWCVLFLTCTRCDTSITNRSGQTARDVALFWGHRHIVRLLSSAPGHDLHQLRDAEEPDIHFNREILDRMSEKRSDGEWLAARRASPETVFLLFHALSPLVRSGAEEDEEIKLCKLRSAAVQELLTDSRTLEVFLGAEKQQEDDGILAWFALSTEEIPLISSKRKIPAASSFREPCQDSCGWATMMLVGFLWNTSLKPVLERN